MMKVREFLGQNEKIRRRNHQKWHLFAREGAIRPLCEMQREIGHGDVSL
jgi:hypothetical protein